MVIINSFRVQNIFQTVQSLKKSFQKIVRAWIKNLKTVQSIKQNFLKIVQSSLAQYFEILKDQIVISKHVPHATILTTLLRSLSEALQSPKKQSNFASSNNWFIIILSPPFVIIKKVV